MNSKKIVIIQNKPTQFDTPLYNQISSNNHFNLFLFYTDDIKSDKEININPTWNNTKEINYNLFHHKSIIIIFKEILQINPDLIIVCGWYPISHYLLTILLKIKGYKIGLRSDNISNSTKFKFIKKIYMPFLLSVYNSWHPVGRLAGNFLHTISFTKKNTYFFPYTIDVDWFRKRNKFYKLDINIYKKKFGIKVSDFVVLGVLKWNDREDPVTLINAIIEVSKKIKNIKLILVGDGPLRPHLEQLFLKLPNTFITPGYISYADLPLYYSLSNIFIHPAIFEPFGVSVQEALSCGLPVITSDKVGSRFDFINIDTTGDVFPAGNYIELSKLILKWQKKIIESNISNDEIYYTEAKKLSYQFTISEFKKYFKDNHLN